MPLWKKRLIWAAVIGAFVLAPATMFDFVHQAIHSLAAWWDALKASEGWH
jgi:hypothetical protein